MAAKRQDKGQGDWRSDWWLWPTALLLVMGSWGQALWMWENVAPEGLTPLWLLLWVGVGVAGVTLLIYWLAHRWRPIAWLTVGAWVGVPSVYELAPASKGWLHSTSPLLLLLLLGIGLSGVIFTVAWFAHRSWPDPTPRMRPFRQGCWSGLFAVICGWLLINRAFSLIPVALLAGALVLLETSFLTRESSRE